MLADFDRDHQLGADPVGAGNEDRILESGALEVEQPAESADFGVRARPGGRPHQRLDQVHHPVAGVDIDPGLGVGQAISLFVHAVWPKSERPAMQWGPCY